MATRDVRGGRRALALLPLLILGLPSPLVAQATDPDPLADFDFEAWRLADEEAAADGEELATARLIRESQKARATCNALIDDINRLATLWGEVRRGDKTREQVQIDLDEATAVWADNSAECRLAHRKLQPKAKTTLTLVWEVEQTKGVWEPLVDLMRAWLDDRPREEINAAADTYAARLAAYGSWLDLHATFWEGRWLEPRGASENCVGDAREKLDELAAGIRAQMILPTDARAEADLAALRASRNALKTSIARCRADPSLGALAQVEAALLGERLDAYSDGIRAMTEGEQEPLSDVMAREQELAGRLVRCRQEHAAGDEAVSAACRPAP